MIHMGQTVSPIGKLMDILKKGDIVTHFFAQLTPAPGAKQLAKAVWNAVEQSAAVPVR